MPLPAPVLAVKGLGWAWGLWFVALGSQRAKRLQLDDVTACSVGPSQLLLCYRLAMLAWGLFIGISQVLDKGSRVFAFYTVWNWWLLTAFFALGSWASLRARRHQQPGRRTKQQAGPAPEAGLLCRATSVTFCVVAPMVLVIDSLTWLVLVPMLKAAERDPERAAMWHSAHHNFESYNAKQGSALGWAGVPTPAAPCRRLPTLPPADVAGCGSADVGAAGADAHV
ncbi:hypothetical protein D9Q98_007935 [Chlorella vulgaris]|uniref:Uncharacterized protein n=1 Tax=Chlorella vulgaris TaxID=3077 RepID=A0A9D4THS5_CHLVU|nr:hypothetical protein D9Q98_007935 [Chlorella vulgaris]